MNVNFEAALKYIDLQNFDKAISELNTAIEAEEQKQDGKTATEYRCVLGELFANLGRKDESRKEFEKVLEYCRENNVLQQQRGIAQTYIDMFDGKITPKPESKKNSAVPLMPKPVQNKGFIAKQMNKRGR